MEMRNGTNLVYRYDGTFPGFLCCVAQCFFDKRLPSGIQTFDEPQATIFPIQAIETDDALARRVERSIIEKISPLVFDMTRRAFLTCMEEKELHMLRFLLLGYRHGAKVVKLSSNDDVYRMDKALLYLKNEAHYHVEFLRFSDFHTFLAAQITPNNNVLPLIAPHFCDRFSCENFMIYDKTHELGFFYQTTGRREFFRAEKLELPPVGEEEEAYRALWKRFYDTIAIEGRKNEKLRMTHMHKRYWNNMTEFQ